MSVLNDSCVQILIPENNDFFPKCDTLSIWTQTTKKSTREKETHFKDKEQSYHKEQIYSDRKRYHLQYDKNTNNATSLHLSGIKVKGEH